MAVFDVPGEYLDSYMSEEKFIFLNIEGKLLDIMCKVNPEHKNNVCVKNGVKVIYL